MKDGDFVEIEYIGKIKESGDIFDLTDEELAKEKGIFNPRTIYGPITVVVGAKHVLAGLDHALLDAKPKDKKTIILEPKDGFGERNPNIVRVVPLSQFKKQNMAPTPGQYITFDQGLRGRVASVNGGRVKLDFNHPLAGKVLENEKAKITLAKEVPATDVLKNSIKEDIKKYVREIKEIDF